MTARLTDDALAELRELEGDPISDGHGHQCARHHGLMFFDDGAEPTRVCDNCAQEIVADALPALLAEVTRARRLEPFHKLGCYALNGWASEDDCDCGMESARRGG